MWANGKGNMNVLKLLIKLELQHTREYDFIANFCRTFNGRLVEYEPTKGNEKMSNRHHESRRSK